MKVSLLVAALMLAGSVNAQTISSPLLSLPDKPKPHHTADKNWWILTLTSLGFVVGDVENTQYLIHSGPGRELNPIFGSAKPTRLAMYGVNLPILGVATYFSYKWKKEDDYISDNHGKPHIIKWWWVPTMEIGAHGAAIGITIGNTGK